VGVNEVSLNEKKKFLRVEILETFFFPYVPTYGAGFHYQRITEQEILETEVPLHWNTRFGEIKRNR
jgi:hypothetical protein